MVPLPSSAWIMRRFIDCNLNRLFLPEEEHCSSSCNGTLEQKRVPELAAAIAQSTAHVDIHSSRWAPGAPLSSLTRNGGRASRCLWPHGRVASSQVVEEQTLHPSTPCIAMFCVHMLRRTYLESCLIDCIDSLQRALCAILLPLPWRGGCSICSILSRRLCHRGHQHSWHHDPLGISAGGQRTCIRF